MARTFWLSALLVGFSALAAAQKTKPTPPPTEDWLRSAETKQAAGDLDGALEALKKAAGVPALAGEAFLRMGRILEGKNDLDTALDAYKQASGHLAGSARGEALGRLALIQEVRGLASESAASAQAAGEADSSGPWAEIALSRLRSREGKGDEALSLAQKAKPAGAPALAAEGRAQEARGDLPAAETVLRQAVQADPRNLLAAIDLARVLRRTQRPSEGLPLVQKVLEGAPGAVGAYMESARIKSALGRADEAQGDAQTAAALAESDPEAQNLAKDVTVQAAILNVKRNQIDLATEELSALLAKDPNFAPAHVGLARVSMAKRALEPAASELETALKLDPKYAEAHYQKGYLNQMFRKNTAAALSSYETAVSLAPDDAGYRTQFGAALVEGGQYARAIQELTRVTALPGYDRPDAFLFLGAAFVGAKRFKEGTAPLEKAIALQPTNAQAEAYLAWCYFGLKDSASFKLHGARARTLGHSEPTLLSYLARVEKGEAIK